MKSRRHPGAAAGDESTARHQYGPAVAGVIPPPPAPSRERRTPPVTFSARPTGSPSKVTDLLNSESQQAERRYTAVAQRPVPSRGAEEDSVMPQNFLDCRREQVLLSLRGWLQPREKEALSERPWTAGEKR